jgi:septum formation protein
LGSSSIGRKTVLEINGWPFILMHPNIDEKSIRTANNFELPQLVAKAKATAVFNALKEANREGEAIIITADTIALFKNNLREKPANIAEAKEFLSSYSNESVSTVSAVIVTHYPSGRQACDVDLATVYWDNISDNIVNSVTGRGEIMSCAGGFKIEDPDLNPLIHSVEGPLDSVMGLPLELTVRLIFAIVNLSEVSSTSTDEFDSGYPMNILAFKNLDDSYRERRPTAESLRAQMAKTRDRSRSNTNWDRSRSNTGEYRNSLMERSRSNTNDSRASSRNRAMTGRR